MVHQLPVDSSEPNDHERAGPTDDERAGPGLAGRGARARVAALAGLLGLTLGGGAARARRDQRVVAASSGRSRSGIVRTRRVEQTVTLSQGVNDGLTVTCSRGMAAIGAGFSLAGGAAPNVHLMSSFPADVESSRSWRFGFRNLHGSRVSATLYAVCTPVQR